MMLDFVLPPLFLSYQINLLGEKDDTPVHFCDKCGLPIKMYGRMVSEIISGRCSHGFPLGKIRFYYVSMRPVEVTDFSRPLNKQEKNIRVESGPSLLKWFCSICLSDFTLPPDLIKQP